MTITLGDIDSFGDAWTDIKEKTYGKMTTKIYRALRPFIDLTDDYRKARQNYIASHLEDGEVSMPRYVSIVGHDGEEVSDEMKEKLGTSESQQWKDYQRFMQEEMLTPHEIDVQPVIDETITNTLTPNQIRVFDVLGLLIDGDQ